MIIRNLKSADFDMLLAYVTNDAEVVKWSHAAGLIVGNGFKLRYEYADKILTLEIVDKPMVITRGMVERKIRAWLSGQLEAMGTKDVVWA